MAVINLSTCAGFAYYLFTFALANIRCFKTGEKNPHKPRILIKFLYLDMPRNIEKSINKM